MLALKYSLFVVALGLLGYAAGLVVFEVVARLRRGAEAGTEPAATEAPPLRWRMAAIVAASAALPFLLASAIAVVPSGQAGVRVSQLSGGKKGTLYPGAHLVTPLVDEVALFLREVDAGVR